MKTKLVTLFIAIFSIIFSSCEKNDMLILDDHIKSDYRILAAGQDTTISATVRAREQTVGLLIAEDAQLRAELMSYTPLPNNMAQYLIRMTNKQSCQVILRWGWENFTPQSIEPTDGTSGTPQSDVLTGNQVKEYIVIAPRKPGRIKVKAEKSNSSCVNSSTLIIDITIDILPIKYTEVKAKYSGDNKAVTITFTIDDPTQVYHFIIQKLINGEWRDIQKVPCDGKTKDWSILIWDDPSLK